MNEQQVISAVQQEGFDVGLAIATDAEVKAGAACGQMALLEDAPAEKISKSLLDLIVGVSAMAVTSTLIEDLISDPMYEGKVRDAGEAFLEALDEWACSVRSNLEVIDG
ncbi:hypothetical protein ACE34P_003167 [Vibrio fluvialis]